MDTLNKSGNLPSNKAGCPFDKGDGSFAVPPAKADALAPTVLYVGGRYEFALSLMKSLGINAYGFDISVAAGEGNSSGGGGFRAALENMPGAFDFLVVQAAGLDESCFSDFAELPCSFDKILLIQPDKNDENRAADKISGLLLSSGYSAQSGEDKGNDAPASILFIKSGGAASSAPEKEPSANNKQQMSEDEKKIIWLRERVDELERTLKNDHEIFGARLEGLSQEKQQILSSFSWRVTKPLRMLVQGVKAVFSHLPGYEWLAAVRNLGLKQVSFNKKHYGTLETPRSGLIPNWQVLAAQDRAKINPVIVFSIVVPLYNTPEKYLRNMLQSVIGQTYPHWELCLADGSDAGHSHVGETVKQYAAGDKRIKYKKLERNMGISQNSNEAVEMAEGDYISLLDHDDILLPNALYEVYKAAARKNGDFIYSDEATFLEDDISHITIAHFKPDFAPDNLRANNYICHFTSFKRSLLAKTGGAFRPEFDGSQDFDLVLRLSEQAENIVHIPLILYLWRSHSQSVAGGASAKPYTSSAALGAINAHMERMGLDGYGEKIPNADSIYKICYRLREKPLVSIIIPNKDEGETLEKCINSIITKSSYNNFEIIICENNSTDEETFNLYAKLLENPRIRLITWQGEFNYSAINNYGVKQAKGDYLLLLNNDTEVISPQWIEEMLMHSQRPEIGAVGAKLYYPDDTLQHCGLVLGMLEVAGHVLHGAPRASHGYIGNLSYTRNVCAVTGACMMLRKKVFEQAGGFDESLKVAFNDVDLCMAIRRLGYLNLVTPFAELYHFESKSRGLDVMPDKQERLISEAEAFKHKWARELSGADPYFNPNLALDTTDYKYDLSRPGPGSDLL